MGELPIFADPIAKLYNDKINSFNLDEFAQCQVEKAYLAIKEYVKKSRPEEQIMVYVHNIAVYNDYALFAFATLKGARGIVYDRLVSIFQEKLINMLCENGFRLVEEDANSFKTFVLSCSCSCS